MLLAIEQKNTKNIYFPLKSRPSIILAPVVQRVDNFIHWIGRLAADKICTRISL